MTKNNDKLESRNDDQRVDIEFEIDASEHMREFLELVLGHYVRLSNDCKINEGSNNEKK